ncbi:MAG: amidase [Thermoanaerobaculia bacterium]|jgi:aspartyl-tRNA(Asn)/glutamyl-tRNA(Gln) amidotransferase subunit A
MSVNPYATIGELGALLRNKQVSSLELTRFYLDRLEKHGTALGAVVTITRERAETEAKRADAEIAKGKWRGPLHGIPYGVKDLLATKGIPTTWGAEPYRGQVFDFDAEVVRRLGEAGAVLCAKLAMVELAGGFGYDTADASFTGPGRTPWNTGHWSGGSSSGPGASVSAALLPFAIGSETSGSIITPCAFSGVTGFRPTYGVVSRHGAMALSWTLDKLGPIARSAADCALVMGAIAGRDPKDESSLRAKIAWGAKQPKPKLKIGIVNASYEGVQAEVRANFEASMKALEGLGHELVEIELPELPYGQVVSTIVDAEGASAFEDLLVSGKAKELRCAADHIGGYEGAATLAVDYLRAMRVRRKIRVALSELLTTKVAMIAAPSRATVAPPVDVKFRDAYPGVKSGPSIIGGTNVAGFPAIALPNGSGLKGLPTSIQIVGPALADRSVIALGEQLQGATDFHRRVPPRFE